VKLTIAEDISVAPAPPDLSDASATVWRDGAGEVVALGQTIDGAHWVHVPGRGAYTFPRETGDVTAVPEPGTEGHLVEDTFRRIILPLALQAQGHEALHASAVRTSAGVVALCAVAGTGKSTLACALSRRGHRLWADDAVCLEFAAGRGVDVRPLPFTLRLRPASAAFFGGAPRQGAVRVPEETAPLAQILVIERAESGSPEIERLPPAEAFREVLTHGYCFDVHDRARNQTMVRHYLELVDRIPAYRVKVSGGLDRLDDTLDVIESAS
jgi:hypothetical protein